MRQKNRGQGHQRGRGRNGGRGRGGHKEQVDRNVHESEDDKSL
jgi:ribosomal protein L15